MSQVDSKRSLQPSPRERFNGFGPSIVSSEARRPLNRLDYSNDLIEARKQVLKNIPICPGVYGWLNSDGCLLYVGKSKSLRHRLTTYFAASPNDAKMEKIRRQSQSLVWEANSHELLALIREQELIDRFRPGLNVQGKPERRKPGFVCVGRGTGANAYFANRVTTKAAEAFGPIAGTGQLREAANCLNYVFQLRDCSDKTPLRFNNQLTLFEDKLSPLCLRYELSSCPAPCSGGCSSGSYRENVQQCLDFLNGRDKSILDSLKQQMILAAANQAYERASVLRDQLNNLAWLHRRLLDLRRAQKRINGILELPGFDHRKVWLVIRTGLLTSSVCRPDNAEKQTALAKELNGVVKQGPLAPKSSMEVNLLLIMISWMKKHPEHMTNLIDPKSIDQRSDKSGSLKHCA